MVWPLLMKGAVTGLGMAGGTKLGKKILGNDDDEDKEKEEQEQQAQQQQQQQIQQPQMQQMQQPQMAGMAAPAAMMAAPTGAQLIGASNPVGAGAGGGQAEESSPFSGKGDDSFLKSAGKTLAGMAVGGIAGATTKLKDIDDGEMDKNKAWEAIKGAAAGAGAGGLGVRAWDSIQKDGGGLGAAVNTGAASALASTLMDGGPGFFSSLGTGLGAGAAANKAHDMLEENGKSKMASIAGATGLLGSLGYSTAGLDPVRNLFGQGDEDKESESAGRELNEVSDSLVREDSMSEAEGNPSREEAEAEAQYT